MKTYIFLTSDGTTLDAAGDDVDNCQLLVEQDGVSALDAYNAMLQERNWTGDFDTCYCYELASKTINRFDLINDEDENGE